MTFQVQKLKLFNILKWSKLKIKIIKNVQIGPNSKNYNGIKKFKNKVNKLNIF